MKRIILVSAALFLHAVCFAADFRVISDTKVYDGDYHYIGELKKGDIVQLFDCSATTDEKLDFAFTLLLNMNGKMRLVDLSTVIPNETSELFDERVRYTTLTTQGKNWIPVQNIDILRSRSRDRYYETYKNKLARYDEPDIFQINWHEHYKVRTAAQIENCFLYFTDEKNYAIFLMETMDKVPLKGMRAMPKSLAALIKGLRYFYNEWQKVHPESERME